MINLLLHLLLPELLKQDGFFLAQLPALDQFRVRALKRKGFADSRIAKLIGVAEAEVSAHRRALGVRPVFKRVDTCAAEFATSTAYMYSTYEDACESRPTDKRKIVILGGGPNRIGQGIEFDYCCVHAALALREDGFETIMVNCNPETVSTDYDTSDRLYFEPLTLEDVMEIMHVEKPFGVIVQYGGQTPLKLAKALEAAGVPIIMAGGVWQLKEGKDWSANKGWGRGAVRVGRRARLTQESTITAGRGKRQPGQPRGHGNSRRTLTQPAHQSAPPSELMHPREPPRNALGARHDAARQPVKRARVLDRLQRPGSTRHNHTPRPPPH